MKHLLKKILLKAKIVKVTIVYMLVGRFLARPVQKSDEVNKEDAGLFFLFEKNENRFGCSHFVGY